MKRLAQRRVGESAVRASSAAVPQVIRSLTVLACRPLPVIVKEPWEQVLKQEPARTAGSSEDFP